MAAASALVLGEGRGLVYHAHEEERRARDDVHALSAHVLKERVVDGRELLGRHRPFQFLEVAKDGPERLRPDLVQGDLRHLGSGILNLVLELVLPLFRCRHLALEVGEPLLSILEFATLVGEFCQDIVQLLLEGLFLLLECVAPVRAKAVIGERTTDGVYLCLDAGPSGLQVGDHRVESLHAPGRLGDLLIQGLEGGTLAVHLPLECTALP